MLDLVAELTDVVISRVLVHHGLLQLGIQVREFGVVLLLALDQAAVN